MPGAGTSGADAGGMDSEMLTTLLVFSILGGGVTAWLAPLKNRSAVAWGALGFLMPVVAIVLVVNLPALPEPPPAAPTARALPPRGDAG